MPGVRKLVHNLVARQTAALALLAWGLCAFVSAEEPISFVLPAANFQPVPADAYPADATQPDESLTPPANPPTPTEIVSPEGTDTEEYMPAEAYEPLDCPNCNGGCDGCGLPPGRLPNGQYPDDWMWGCGQWPYANGPGTCDDWKVGPIWHVTADGIFLSRDDADLDALFDATDTNSVSGPQGAPQVFDQFDYAAGGRIFLTSEIPHLAGYEVQAGYEGIDEWNASIVYPKITPYPTNPNPPAGPTNSSEQRTVFYRSSLQSAELNFSRQVFTVWRPFCGVRYVKFDDEINDTINQEVPPPLASPAPSFSVSETDRVNLFDLENQLIGFQIGARHELWHPSKRWTLEGFINAGVYYNHIKRTNLMSLTTTQFTSEDTDLAGSEARTDVSSTSNLDVSEPSDVATIGEASLTGVFRLNRCWALRGGYQVLWIDGVSLAQDAFLNTGIDSRSLLFQGCHVGIECRR